MVDKEGLLNKIVQVEATSMNRQIIKGRKSLARLLDDPRYREGDLTIPVDKAVLKKVSESLSLPAAEVLLPITIYVPAGTTEGYIKGQLEAKAADQLGAEGMSRAGKYWVQKYRALTLCRTYPNIFQVFYTV